MRVVNNFLFKLKNLQDEKGRLVLYITSDGSRQEPWRSFQLSAQPWVQMN